MKGKTSKYKQKTDRGRSREPGFETTEVDDPLAVFDRLIQPRREKYWPFRLRVSNRIVCPKRLAHLVKGLEAGIRTHGIDAVDQVIAEALDALRLGEDYQTPQQRGDTPARKTKKQKRKEYKLAHAAARI